MESRRELLLLRRWRVWLIVQEDGGQLHYVRALLFLGNADGSPPLRHLYFNLPSGRRVERVTEPSAASSSPPGYSYIWSSSPPWWQISFK